MTCHILRLSFFGIFNENVINDAIRGLIANHFERTQMETLFRFVLIMTVSCLRHKSLHYIEVVNNEHE